MNFLLRITGTALSLALYFCATTASFAAATITQQVNPPELNVGEQTIITLVIQSGSIGGLRLPPVDGLQVVGTSSSMNFVFKNGALTRNLTLQFAAVPSRAGDFTIPAFDIKTQDNEVLHVKEMTIHVFGATPPITNAAPQVQSPIPGSDPTASATTATPFNPNGPVVMPNSNFSAASPAPAPANAGTQDQNNTLPREPDGTPAKVFLIITPQTTESYVGEAIPLEIDFFIRMEVNADQNSLPTIKGSDFLMNNFTTRGHAKVFMLENMQYECETWLTAISAPKSGDFPLAMSRDTYWIKSVSNNGFDPFGRIFGRRANLAHESITSNQLMVHVHPLPTEGQPPHFTGAIGQFQVTGDARPSAVAVGEPLTLHFNITGTGNFDYVRAPFVPEDSAWKAYVASSKIGYRNESHTNAIKLFEQSIIPNKNGVLPLPQATFSYFDPDAKKYVTIDVPLPAITVTGAPQAAAAPSAKPLETTTATAPPNPNEFTPNRLELGSLQTSLTPAYRHAWFWIAQGVFVALPIAGLAFLYFRKRNAPVDDRGAAVRRLSQQQEEDAMTEAVRRNDASAFFLSARHAIQLQLGSQWNIKPEALTLGEIRARDPQLAENLEELFKQTDEVIYSGKAASNLNLADWEKRVREMLQLQTA